MAKAGTAYVEVLGDFSKLRRQLAVEMAKLDKDIELDVDIDRSSLAGVNRELDVTKRSATGAGGALGGLGRNLRKTGGEFVSFKSRIPILQLGLMGSAAYNAAGGVIALAGALAPLSGLLGSVGPLATAAAQGLGTIKLATSGVGDAISAAFAEQDSAASAATASLGAQVDAAEGVRSAHQALASAQRTAKFAQEDLTQAREDATRQIEDMKASVRSLALEEEGASLSLKEAKQAYSELAASGADELEIERASLRIREAREELKKTRVEGRRAREEMAGVEAGGGVRGMPQVVSARRSLEDANRAVADSQRELVKATKQASQAMASGGAAASAFEEKLAKLPLAGQKFARFIISLRPKIKQLQATAAQGLFPGVEAGIKSASKNLPVLDRVIARTSRAFGDLAEQAGQRLGSTEWGKDLETQGIRNERTIRRLGDSGLDLAEIFKDVTLAAGPLVDRLTKWVGALTEGWKESANAARESGKLQRFFKDAGDTFFKTVRILRDLAVAFKNIGSAARQAFGNELLGGIERGAAGLRKWTESARGQRELVAIFTDIGDRLKRLGGFIKDLFGDFRQMRAEGQSAGDALGQVFLTALSKVIEKAGELGVKFAKAFVRGFIDADVGGKAILAAFAISKFGGVGRALGLALGIGVSQGAAAGVAGGAGAAAGGGLLARIGSKLLPVAKRLGIVGLGVALADVTLKEFSRRMGEGSGDAFKELENAAGPDPLGLFSAIEGSFVEDIPGFGKIFTETERSARSLIPALKEVAKSGRAISPDRAEELRKQIAALPGISNKARDAMLGIVDASAGSAKKIFTIIGDLSNTFDKVGDSTAGAVKLALSNIAMIGDKFGFESKRGTDAVRDNFRALSVAIRNNMKEGRTSVQEGFRAMRQFAVQNSRDVAGSAQKNFGDARDFIVDAMRDGIIKTRTGMKLLRDLWFTEMAFYGFSKKDALNIRRARTTRDRVLNDFSPRGQPHRQQRGGPIDIGKPHGDSVNAVLEKGEYVLNRKAVQRIGRDQLDEVNFRDAPRFQRGGIAGMVRAANKLEQASFPYVWGGGHQASPAPFGPMDCSGAVSFVLQQGGVQIPTMVSGALASAGKPGPGAVTVFANAGHTFMRIGNRYFGTSGTNPGGGAGWFPDPGDAYESAFAQRHFAGGAAIGDRTMPGVEVTGPGSGVQAIVEGVLGSARAGAQRLLDSAATASIGRGDAGDSGPAGDFSKSALQKLWIRAGGDPNFAKVAAAVAMAESGGRSDASNTNSNGSVDRGLWQINSIHGQLSTFDPLANARAAVQISSRGTNWNPWVAYKSGAYRNFLQRGGLAEAAMQLGGDPFDKIRNPNLAKSLRRTLKKIGKTKKKAGRAKLLEGFVKKLEKLGLPKNLMDEINRLAGDHALFDQYATSAGELTVENDDGTSTLGVIKGPDGKPLNEIGWTAKDLDAQFKMRNRLVKAREIVVTRRAQVTRAFEIAKNRLKDLSKGGKTPAGWKGLNPARDPVEKWNKQPQAKRLQRKKEWRRKHGSLPGSREFDEKTGKLTAVPSSRISALKKLVPELRDQKTLLTAGIQTKIRVPLEELQGIGGSTKHLRSPWPIGTIPAGSIFQTQLRLQQLGAKPDVTDTEPLDDSGTVQRLRELLRIKNQEDIVEAIQTAELLRTARQPPFAGVFHQGGVVPGPVGAERVALVTGGEVITPPQSKSGSRDNDRFRLIVEDHRVRVYRNDVEMIVDQKLRGVSRGVGRVPGLAGSLKP